MGKRRVRAQERIPLPRQRAVLLRVRRHSAPRDQARRRFRQPRVVAKQALRGVLHRIHTPAAPRRRAQVVQVAGEPRRDFLGWKWSAAWRRSWSGARRARAARRRRPAPPPHPWSVRRCARAPRARAPPAPRRGPPRTRRNDRSPRAHPLRVAVPAEVERHGAAREQRSKRVEGAGVVEPAVQEQGGLSVSALQRVEREPAHVEQAVVHGRQRNILTARPPFVTRAQWQIRSSASSWAARPISRR